MIRWSLWQKRWGILAWSLGVVSLVGVTLAFYPTIHDQAAQLNKSFGGLSKSTLDLFGGTDFFSPVGYLNSQIIYFTLPLVLSILGISLGNSLIGREETDGSIELLLSRPVSRSYLLGAKALAGFANLLAVTAVSSATIILLASLVNMGIPLVYIAAACFAMFMLVLAFSALAFLLAATGRGRAMALGASVGYALGGYILSSLASSVHWLQNISIVFPYHYYRTADILHGTFNWSSIIFFAAFTIGCGLLAWLSFRRRDLA
ncbi:MAG TPA: ABC transporter permease subunit [Candidatus Saccharimonadales bacterium]|nr:ABC transporter permease subunit [Candidatus Saccharimonadales bacterium]